jgi:hypothetical protein
MGLDGDASVQPSPFKHTDAQSTSPLLVGRGNFEDFPADATHPLACVCSLRRGGPGDRPPTSLPLDIGQARVLRQASICRIELDGEWPESDTIGAA